MPRITTLLVLSVLSLTALAAIASQTAQAQTFTVIHAFSGGQDGYRPYAGLTLDRQGTIYGTTAGALPDEGTVFQLKRVGGSWVLNTIDSQENFPLSRVVFGSDGSLYGTDQGGSPPPFCEFGCGSIYRLQPACISTGSCPWRESLIHGFSGGADGANPNFDPVFDQAGNLYGAASVEVGGVFFDGIVFRMVHSGGQWTQNVIQHFSGSTPSGVVFDSAGNLYGTTASGGIYHNGSVFRLTPSGSAWVLSTLYSFQGGADGMNPNGTLLVDPSGNLYGTTISGGPGGGGTVFELSPSGGSWTFNTLYGLSGGVNGGPKGNLAMDSAGNLYGAASSDGAFGDGSVFKLTAGNGAWTYTDLHDFAGSDGANPIGGVTLDTDGDVYGTTVFGGDSSGGVVWEIMR